MAKKLEPIRAGILQSFALLIYCSFIWIIFYLARVFDVEMQEPLGVTLFLFLFVFSAAVCGLIVFGYPVYLVLNKKIREALQVLGWFFISSLGIFIVGYFFSFIVSISV